MRMPRAERIDGARQAERGGADDEHLLAGLRIGTLDAFERRDHGFHQRCIARGHAVGDGQEVLGRNGHDRGHGSIKAVAHADLATIDTAHDQTSSAQLAALATAVDDGVKDDAGSGRQVIGRLQQSARPFVARLQRVAGEALVQVGHAAVKEVKVRATQADVRGCRQHEARRHVRQRPIDDPEHAGSGDVDGPDRLRQAHLTV